ncbi:GGDEF domain-containing protein [Metasolibacillus fluoroglycofenilyticus]|uniref:GGDEF domain-containing protein n=1 Tax=Metasolibacillus fluoroglycofenilyticus TaxID=1239396 RepID=UPI000D35B09F|nr:GGDEF domain-containing protein [Metasolibacillus fluoroglycofenilyticus]
MKNLHFKLFLSLIIFAIILVTVVTFTNRKLIQNDIKEQTLSNWLLIESQVIDDLQTIDTVQYYLEDQLTHEVEKELRKMANLYNENPDVATWDLERMKKEHGMEIFILDETNTVIHTTYPIDLGMNFNECCQELSRILTQRRMSGEFFSDGLDGSTKLGEVWKYSYLATPDHKYLLELGVPMNKIPLFGNFNFFDKAKIIIGQYDDLLDIKIFNKAGFHLSANEDEIYSVNSSDPEFQEAFQRAIETSSVVQYEKYYNGGIVETYRFLPYDTLRNKGYSTKRVAFMKYNNMTELALLKKNTQQFYFTLVIAIITSFITLVVLNLILMKTIRLAERDPLTGVYNRSTYLEKIERLLKRKQHQEIGLLLFDVDNFKQVNDQYGHLKGDMILVELAKILERLAHKEGFVVRFGGDEFAIVIKNATLEKMERIANEAIEEVRLKKESNDLAWQVLSLSIGGTLQANIQETERDLYSRADDALYASKNDGKNRYSLSAIS